MTIQEIAANRRDRPNPSFSANLVGVFAWMGKIVILCRGCTEKRPQCLRPLAPSWSRSG